ncbi:unnamed protein product [Rotaria sp. Silwood2]|nr:unnamed protein product [Rotaria sp. Silwood2]CAF4509415.1 unnamed protein product [Rotaria sp. Silwood2]
MLPQDQALDILVEFLKIHGKTAVNKIDVKTIRELASIVLEENVFVYGSKQQLRDLLKDANTWHPNIKLDYKISQSLSFLDVLLTNNHGILSTSVYHKPTAEPYVDVVSFISDHSRHVFDNIIKTALVRAVRYSSTFQAFQSEQRYIKLMLLYSG